MSQYDNDQIIFDYYAENQCIAAEAVDDFYNQFMPAIEVARKVQKDCEQYGIKGDYGYDALCKAIGHKLVTEVMKYGQTVAIAEEYRKPELFDGTLDALEDLTVRRA